MPRSNDKLMHDLTPKFHLTAKHFWHDCPRSSIHNRRRSGAPTSLDAFRAHNMYKTPLTIVSPLRRPLGSAQRKKYEHFRNSISMMPFKNSASFTRFSRTNTSKITLRRACVWPLSTRSRSSASAPSTTVCELSQAVTEPP